MPKKIIHEFKVEFLQILDEAGRVDRTLWPALDEKEVKGFYEAMLLIRTFDEKALNLQREGRLGTYASVQGQEAAQVGSATALRPSDWIFPAFREPGVSLLRGLPMRMIYQYWSGDERGSAIPEDQHDFPIAIPVGTHIPHAVGAAWAAQFKGDPVAVATFFGDGATSKGDFHEGLNFAGVFRLPIVFICQNNHWAISVPLSRQTASATLAQKAIAYGFEGIQVDGNDVFAVYTAVKNALEKARRGEGPTLIECFTYRLSDHTTADDASRYRKAEDVAAWRKKDPLVRLRALLEREYGWSEADEQTLRRQAQERVAAAVHEFEAVPPANPEAMFDTLFANLTPDLLRQKEQLRKRLQKKERD
ncbi:MAG: pyruvate dehydrogenase (acetyl-transferring) E1 component subunit alpha [Candidatus Manganitrophaceae bacterium]|nr:MAG: pyruvate dehydrogenase (acetyl-transferring) E1 component subunit alpha [Candidatus Manganitrophaceae bacterium]